MRKTGPIADPVPCSGCGRLLDPLRAGHVAIFDQRFHYFCSANGCRTAYLADLGVEPTAPRPSPSPDPVRASHPFSIEIENAHAPFVPEDVLPEPPRTDDTGLWVEPIGQTISSDGPPRTEAVEPREIGVLFLLIAVLSGALAVLLGLAGTSSLVLGARVLLAGLAAGILVARVLTIERDAADPHPVAPLAAPVLSVLVAGFGAWTADPTIASEAASLAGIVNVALAASTYLLEVARDAVEHERAWIWASLSPPPQPARRGERETAPQEEEPRPGDEILVAAGDVVPVDLVVKSDEADVFPWVGARTQVRKRPGDAVVAGARVVRGTLRGAATWVALDRAYPRVLIDPRRRADVLAPVARAARSLSERWSFAASAVAGGIAFFMHRTGVEICMAMVAVQAGLSTVVSASLASNYVSRGILLALRRGITYKSADAWHRAAKADLAVFCGRGTLLRGEPEVAEVESLSKTLSAEDVLSLVAGAERADPSPVGHAILRAAKQRGVRADGVRNPIYIAGAGVVGLASTGEEVIVGSRELLLAERVAFALAEERLVELEALGRTVTLVALAGRLAGLVALQDGIRPGARAAVQHLLDAQIEPVLLSSDARQTCEAMGRSLDIEHLRPEVSPEDRAQEVRTLREGGANVAVFGHLTPDEEPLRAADVAVALSAAGTSEGEIEVALASDDVRDAALSLAIARRTEIEARVGFGISALPGAVGAAIVAVGVLPPAFVPIAALIGGVMAVFHSRTLDRLRTSEKRAEELS